MIANRRKNVNEFLTLSDSHIESDGRIFQELNAAIAISDLAEILGIEVDKQGFAFAVDREENNPSLKIYPDHAWDYGTGKRYSALDIVMLVRGCDLRSAAKWLAEKAGLPEPSFNGTSEQWYAKNRQKSEAYE